MVRSVKTCPEVSASTVYATSVQVIVPPSAPYFLNTSSLKTSFYLCSSQIFLPLRFSPPSVLIKLSCYYYCARVCLCNIFILIKHPSAVPILCCLHFDEYSKRVFILLNGEISFAYNTVKLMCVFIV